MSTKQTPRKIFAVLSVFALAFAGSIAVTTPANAATESVTKVISGFGDSSTELTANIKKKIKKFINNNPDFNQVSCTGYADNPGNKSFNDNLGTKRAKNSCEYAVSINSALSLGELQSKNSKGRGADVRRVQITLSQAEFTVYYDYMGGTGTVESATYELSSTEALVLPEAQKLGYRFIGWHSKQYGGTKIGSEGERYTPTKSIILYAQWAPEQDCIVPPLVPSSSGPIVPFFKGCIG